MRNAVKALILACGAAALVGCHKQQQNQLATQDMSIDDDNVASNDVDSNAQIETLPPDESSTTSNGELSDGEDQPDVTAVDNSD